MLPSLKVASSAPVKATDWADPVPVRVLVTVRVPSVNTTVSVAPASPVTRTAPAVASALVTPLEAPLASARVGAAGATVSTVKLAAALLAAPGLPAASDKRTLRAWAPWLSATFTVMLLAPALHTPALRSPAATV